MKKNKKIKSICWIIAIIMVSVQFFSLSTIYANTEENTENKSSVILNSIFDLKALSGEYKVSDEKSDIYLPFLRNTAEKIVIDKPIGKIGILSSGKTIEVNEQLKNLQFLFAKDTIRVNSNMEYTLIWSGNDVVINSDIARNSIIFAGGEITIGENANIGDDTIFVANSVNIKGKINGSALVTSPKINISGTIEKDLRCDTDDIDISSNDNIKGNILVNTYNKNINLKDKYSNAVINIKESNKDSNGFGKILIQILINCLMYTLLYFIIKKISKGKLYEYMLNKSKNNIIFIIISSAVCLLAFPLIFILLIILSIVGLYIVTVPILICYITFLIVFSMLSVFIVGSTIFEYTNKKYIKAAKKSSEFAGVFCSFLSLCLLEKIPAVGGYISMSIIIVGIGIVITCIFKKNNLKNIVSK